MLLNHSALYMQLQTATTWYLICFCQGTAINMLQMHPSGRRLMVHTRNNKLQLLDLRVSVLLCISLHYYLRCLAFRCVMDQAGEPSSPLLDLLHF